MPRVNPDNLRWARETAGLGEEEAAKKVGLGPARGVGGVERLQLLELGEDEPSRALLTNMARVYRRPLLSFYAAGLPGPGERVEDFRALPDKRPESEPLVQALVRDVRTRQALVKEVLEEEEAPAHAFVGSQAMATGAARVAEIIARDLGFGRERFRSATSVEAAFIYARECAERAGVFVLLIGDLGSHHTEVDTEAFRGFALSDAIAPFVVINDRDAHSAWTFTLFHELAHLWLGVSGVSGARAKTPIERFCNDVASLMLLPTAEAARIVLPAWDTTDDLAAAIAKIARPLRLSRTLVAYRLHQAGVLTGQRWEELRDHFRALWRAERASRRDDRRPGAQGPNPYVVKRHHLGPALLALVARAVSEGALTATRAGKVLGVRARNVDVVLGRAG